MDHTTDPVMDTTMDYDVNHTINHAICNQNHVVDQTEVIQGLSPVYYHALI